MNWHIRMPEQRPGESHADYVQRLADEAQFAARISMGLAVIAVVCAIVAVLLP